ncbi:hypothetical protein L1987_30365 [Smallanthus sonchifolius]|uniref:Uncharacterized protein n=1 Tax=Smallanthus sonchifolius TaxID=185202 RepID=A0ACB9I4E3_9ASTR|nr:hypothetical protein L1987_30365 [Smallanthus sonchifolius]
MESRLATISHTSLCENGLSGLKYDDQGYEFTDGDDKQEGSNHKNTQPESDYYHYDDWRVCFAGRGVELAAFVLFLTKSHIQE